MKLPPRIAGPELGPLDFLCSMASEKQKWLQQICNPSSDNDIKLLHSNFMDCWSSIKEALLAGDKNALKEMQSHLSPWPPVALLALEPQHSPMVHAAWQSLLEFHTHARLIIENPVLAESASWRNWYSDIHNENMDRTLLFPSQTNVPGVFRTDTTLAIVTTQPFSFVQGNLPLIKLLNLHKTASIFRLQSPSCSNFDNSYSKAAKDLFGAHSDREISKLSFWSMVGAQKEQEALASLKWKPRYYGGPSGTPSWALHDSAVLAGQAASKSRFAMLDWMTALSDSLHEQLHHRNDIIWTPAHNDFLRAYTLSWHAVTRIGVSHKRTAMQVNELLSYTTSIQKQLERTQNPGAPHITKALSWTSQRLQNTNSHSKPLELPCL